MGARRHYVLLALALLFTLWATPAGAQSVQFSPNPFTFLPQAVGSPSSSFKHLFIKNTGVLPLVVTSATISGTDFSFSSGGTTLNIGTIDPGATFSTILAFRATTAGLRTGTLTLQDNAPGSPHFLSISSQGFTSAGIQAPDQDDGILLAAPSIGTATSATETIISSGSQSVSVTSVSISGTGFSLVTNSCTGTLNPGQTCNVQVSFNPTTAGAVSGTLSINNTGFLNPLVIPLSGDAADFAIIIAPGFTGTATVTAGQVAQFHLNLTSPSGLAGATGGVNVTCSGLPPGASCNVTQTPDPQGFFTTVSLGIVTTGHRARSRPPFPGLEWPVAAIILAILFSAGTRRNGALLSLLLATAFCVFLTSCGTGGGSGSSSGVTTPPGTYTVTISATRSNLTRTLSLTLNVQ